MQLSSKIIVVGAMGCGKSSLLIRFVQEDFKGTTGPTIGVDFLTKAVEIKGSQQKLQIWDTGGQEEFQSTARSYYREAAAAIVVYDVCSRASFAQIPKWLQAVRENVGNKEVVITLVGTKVDMVEKRKVTREEGELFARQRNLLFVEASAKTGEGVDLIFMATAGAIARKVDQGIFNLDDKTYGVQRIEKKPLLGNGIADATSRAALREDGWCCT